MRGFVDFPFASLQSFSFITIFLVIFHLIYLILLFFMFLLQIRIVIFIVEMLVLVIHLLFFFSITASSLDWVAIILPLAFIQYVVLIFFTTILIKFVRVKLRSLFKLLIFIDLRPRKFMGKGENRSFT